MEILYVILAALAPVVVLLLFIFWKDRNQPEPTKWLIKAFVFGLLSVPLSLCFSQPAEIILGLGSVDDGFASMADAFFYAFSMAAVPEELAKLIMLWLLLRKNEYYDEQFDGIVYAACIGMGFAGLENIMYLGQGFMEGSWISTGVTRAIFAVPGHFIYAVLMGYYYSLFHFRIRRNLWTGIMVILAPVILHGIYDGILFSIDINENLSVLLMILFIIFFVWMVRRGKKKIQSLVNK